VKREGLISCDTIRQNSLEFIKESVNFIKVDNNKVGFYELFILWINRTLEEIHTCNAETSSDKTMILVSLE
jgi:hypothetical protein